MVQSHSWEPSKSSASQ